MYLQLSREARFLAHHKANLFIMLRQCMDHPLHHMTTLKEVIKAFREQCLQTKFQQDLLISVKTLLV